MAKNAVVRALMDRVDTHIRKDDLEGQRAEKLRVIETLESNGYPKSFVQNVDKRRTKTKDKDSADEARKDSFWISLPYMRGLSEPVARVLRPLGINVAHRAEQWKWRLCKEIKDQLPMNKRKGVVYSIECDECRAIYIGETGRTLDDRLKEHQRHTRLVAPEKSAVAEHALTMKHEIDCASAKVIDTAAGTVKRRVKEKLHLEKVSRSQPVMNKDKGLNIEKAWLTSL